MNIKLLRSAAREEALTLEGVMRTILPGLSRVEGRLKETAEEGEGILKESSRYVLGGGKRLRASLVLYCASLRPEGPAAAGPGRPEAAVEIAAAVELIHSATLVHDDIVDRSVLRRLKPTANIQFGEEVALLLGDFLYARAFEMIAHAGDREITALMAGTTRRMCEGELDQLRHRYRADLSLPEYLSFVERKTAALIGSCAAAGARLAALPAEQVRSLEAFGTGIGIAFQVVDDLLDIIGEESRLGKTLRNDADNGKMTLPLILLLQSAEPEAREGLKRNLQSVAPDWTMIEAAMRRHDVVERSRQFAEDYFTLAVGSLEALDPDYRKTLTDLARFILNRDH